MEIRIRSGDDWIEIDVDGKPFHVGHSMPEKDWIELLKRAGATVIEEEGDFCEECGGWFTTETCPCEQLLGSFDPDPDGDGIEEEPYGG